MQITGRARHNVMTSRQQAFLRRLPGVDADRYLSQSVKEGRDIIGGLTTTTNDWVPTALALTAGGKYKGSKVKSDEGSTQNEAWLKLGSNYIRDDNGRIVTNEKGAAMINDGTFIRAATDFDFFDKGTMAAAKNLGHHRGTVQAAIEYTYGSVKSQEDIDRVNEGVNALNWAHGEKIGLYKGVGAQLKGGMLQFKAGDPVKYFRNGAVRPDSGVKVPRMGVIPQKLVNEMAAMETYPLSRQDGTLWEDATMSIQQLKAQRAEGKISDQEWQDYQRKLRGIGVRAGGLLDAVAAGESYTIDPETGDQIFIAGSQASTAAEASARKFYNTLLQEMPELGLMTPEQMAAMRTRQR